ncbi:MAG: hypothetical protein IKC10_00565 [Alphaproteobacteria bacterium]|nr:hypothetical protein [Alphaproteobacteria bacterium]
MAKYETENKYYIAESSEGELYVYISAKKASPIKPQIVYDGYDHALFVRSPEENIILDYINPEARDKLRKAREVIVVETLIETIKDAYIANMNIVDKIPVDWSQIGLTTWDEKLLGHK